MVKREHLRVHSALVSRGTWTDALLLDDDQPALILGNQHVDGTEPQRRRRHRVGARGEVQQVTAGLMKAWMLISVDTSILTARIETTSRFS